MTKYLLVECEEKYAEAVELLLGNESPTRRSSQEIKVSEIDRKYVEQLRALIRDERLAEEFLLV